MSGYCFLMSPCMSLRYRMKAFGGRGVFSAAVVFPRFIAGVLWMCLGSQMKPPTSFLIKFGEKSFTGPRRWTAVLHPSMAQTHSTPTDFL